MDQLITWLKTMSQPDENVTIPPTGGQTKTLIMQHPGTFAMLMTPQGDEGMMTEAKEFTDVHRALDWCIRNAVNFYCVCLADPTGN